MTFNKSVVVMGLAAIGMAAALLSIEASAGAQTDARIQGAYAIRRSAQTSERAARLAAIDAATRKLEPDEAKRWHGLLRIVTTPQARVQLAFANGEVAVSKGDRPALKSAASGAVRAIDSKRQVAQRMEAEALVQRLTTTELAGQALPSALRVTTQFALGKDERTLTVQTRVEGGGLAEPVVFNTTYDRI